MNYAPEHNWKRAERGAAGDCPDEAALIAWIERGEESDIDRHVARCDTCLLTSKDLRAISSAPVEAVPAALREKIERQVSVSLNRKAATVHAFSGWKPALIGVAALLLVGLTVYLSQIDKPATPPPPVETARTVGAWWLGGKMHDTVYGLDATPDGGTVTAGVTQSFTDLHHAILINRTDKSGALTWSRTYMGGHACTANDVTHVGDDRYVIAGLYEEEHGQDNDALLIAIDGDGEVIWSRLYGGDGEDRFTRIVADLQGGVYAVATSNARFRQRDGGLVIGTRSTEEDLFQAQFVTRIDEDGNALWTRWLPAISVPSGPVPIRSVPHLAVSPNGDLWVTGGVDGSNGLAQGQVSCLSPDGSMKWQKRYTSDSNGLFESISFDANGNAVVGGYQFESNLTAYRMWVTRLDTEGNVIASATVDTPDSTQCKAVVPHADGNVSIVSTRIMADQLQYPPMDRHTEGLLATFSPELKSVTASVLKIDNYHQVQLYDAAVSSDGEVFGGGFVHTGLNSWDALLLHFDDGLSTSGKLESYEVNALPVTVSSIDAAFVEISGPTAARPITVSTGKITPSRSGKSRD